MRVLASRKLLAVLCLAAGAGSAIAQGSLNKRYLLTADFIASALHNDGFDVRADDVRLPMQLSTSVSNPSLQLVGADRLPDGHLRMRMRCRNVGECLPFHVTVSSTPPKSQMAATAAAPALLAQLPIQSHASSPAPLVSAGPVPLPSAATESAPAQKLSPGAPLMLLLDDGQMHIHLPVVTLDTATVGGEVVRVTTPDHKHIYRATVIDANTARGIIE